MNGFYAAQFIIIAYKKSMSFLIACYNCGLWLSRRAQLHSDQCTIDVLWKISVCQTVHFSLNMNLLPFTSTHSVFDSVLLVVFFLCMLQFNWTTTEKINVYDRMGNKVRERANPGGNRETKNKRSLSLFSSQLCFECMHSTSIFCPNIHVKSSFPLMFIMCV